MSTSLVETAWDLMEERLWARTGTADRYVDSARAAFCAGVYAAAAALLVQHAGAEDLSEAADRLDRR